MSLSLFISPNSSRISSYPKFHIKLVRISLSLILWIAFAVFLLIIIIPYRFCGSLSLTCNVLYTSSFKIAISNSQFLEKFRTHNSVILQLYNFTFPPLHPLQTFLLHSYILTQFNPNTCQYFTSVKFYLL